MSIDGTISFWVSLSAITGIASSSSEIVDVASWVLNLRKVQASNVMNSPMRQSAMIPISLYEPPTKKPYGLIALTTHIEAVVRIRFKVNSSFACIFD